MACAPPAVATQPPLPADADNAAAAAALNTGMMQIDAKTGRWEMRDEWLSAVTQASHPACSCLPSGEMLGRALANRGGSLWAAGGRHA